MTTTKRKPASINKPVLANEALRFATWATATPRQGEEGKGESKRVAKNAVKSLSGQVPENDVRLTAYATTRQNTFSEWRGVQLNLIVELTALPFDGGTLAGH